MGDSGYGLELRGIEFLLKNQIGRTIEYNCDVRSLGISLRSWPDLKSGKDVCQDGVLCDAGVDL